MKEIERKFLPVTGFPIPFTSDNSDLEQVYIQKPGETTVCRVRIENNVTAFMTMKSPSEDQGLTREELETEIPVDLARTIMDSADREYIIKERYRIPHENVTFEVDVFFGMNSELTLIEVELPTTTTEVNLPAWVGDEVTGNDQYTNAYLSDHPYNEWEYNAE